MGNKKMVIIPKIYWVDIKELEEEKQIKITLEHIGNNGENKDMKRYNNNR
jgi:hypothetical protein